MLRSPGCTADAALRMQSLRLEDGVTVPDAITALAAEVRENIKLRRGVWCAAAMLRVMRPHTLIAPARRLSGDDCVIGSYAHAGPSRATGRIGSLVALRVHGACACALCALPHSTRLSDRVQTAHTCRATRARTWRSLRRSWPCTSPPRSPRT